MENMNLYNSVRNVPENAQKQIQAGRLKGKTDINPMWRIKALTEQFGPCGIGWKYTIDRQWTEAGSGSDVAAFVNISLYIKADGQWSEAIPGTGGSSFVTKEKNGPYTSDECYKMALTDAISVACKALGFGADIYWSADRTKYDAGSGSVDQTTPAKVQGKPIMQKSGPAVPPKTDEPVQCERCGKLIPDWWDGKRMIKAAEIAERARQKYNSCICFACGKEANNAG